MNSKFLLSLMTCTLFGASGISHAAGNTPPLPMANAQSQGVSVDGIKRIDAFFADEIANNRMPGAVLAVAKNGKLVIYKSYGFLNKATNTPMPLDAIFNLASMTKVMAAVGALTFYEEGKMPLNAPISNWYPQMKDMKVGIVAADGSLTTVPAKNPITIQDLMRHTNGLTYGARGNSAVHKLFPSASVTAAFDYTGPEFMDKLATIPLLYEPGTVWDYGFGIDVLGLIEEKIANKPLGSVLQERVWSKVVMPDTSFQVADNQRARLAQPLPLDPMSGKPQKIKILTDKVKFDCGGSCAFSTAGDYIRFGQMMLNGGSLDGKRVLGPQTVAFMTSNHLNKDIKNLVGGTEPGRVGYGFGLGVAVRMERGLSAINGNVGDYTWNGANGTLFWVDPKEQMVVVMMAVAPGDIRKIHREKVNALVYGALEK
ncbi:MULTISPECIES: serine hydrolase [unclassified Polynucleobacter]|uniref:serine hydrolase domain-containing protein n=1 Tax=unclassified Polynucleobacter TaxID=2640945 RepID=UPI001F395D61|nr:MULTISPECIES: serine hydrolase domain-containing protein [unclassified Polynucleobacter]MCE7527934.1 beta-lactamase family protein [Polynucleobacter sp. IMCC 30228]MCE7530138.1 beta-lactamase family protein [Polynucleobacter sp. IMCC 29146]